MKKVGGAEGGVGSCKFSTEEIMGAKKFDTAFEFLQLWRFAVQKFADVLSIPIHHYTKQIFQ